MGQRAALYARVSTSDQSCERQVNDLTAFAERGGYEVVGVFKETASGTVASRAARNQIIELAQARQIDAVLVTELSRWGRSTQDLLDTLHRLAGWKVSVVAMSGMTFELDTPHGRTGLAFSYSKRSGVEHIEILAPATAPPWVFDRAALWNAVEAAETRKNSQVAREIRVALPHELRHEARVALVRDFVQQAFVDRGMVADIALHAPGREGDDRNHHAHILLTTREIGPEGFTTKNRDWNAIELLGEWREAWAEAANRALEREGVEARVDHRTLDAQKVEAHELAVAARERGDEAEELRQTVRSIELDRPPLPQLSAGAWQLKERGIEVASVRVWHEVKAQAAEVMRVAQDLAGHVRDWLGRGQDLAARLREAWEARQARVAEAGDAPDAALSLDPVQSLADRLREAAASMSPLSFLRQGAQLKGAIEEQRDQRDAEVLKAEIEAEMKAFEERLRDKPQKQKERDIDFER